MLRRLLMASLRPVLAGLLFGLPLAAWAQVWTANTCSSCHGVPPSIAASSAAGSSIIGLGEGFMSDAASLRARVIQAGNLQNVAVMKNLSVADADEVFGYFVAVRDASVTTPAPSFADTLVGATRSVAFSFDVSNYRSDALGYSIGFSGGTAPGDFVVQSHTVSGAGCTAGSVPAASSVNPQTCTVNLSVTFTPGAAGTRSTSLVVDLSNTSNPQPLDRSFGLSGVGLEPLVVSTAPLSFTAVVGPPAGSDAKTLIVTDNKGDAVRACLVEASVALGFSFPDDYTLTTPNVGTARCATYDPATPSLSRPFGITFTPGASGPRNATLEVQRLDTALQPTGPLFSVSLLGNRGPVAMANATSLFDGVEVEITGSVSAQRSVQISSRGNDPLVFSGFSIAPGAQTEYSLAGTGCQALPGSQLAAFTGGTAASCLVTVNFDPSAVGPRTATLNIATDAGAIAIGLNGIGSLAPRLQVIQGITILASGGTVDFGPQTIGGLYPPRRLTLHNVGTSRGLELILPAAPAGFAFAPGADCVPVLAPGGNCSLDIGFAPTVTAPPYDAGFAFASRDATTADALTPFALRLTGQGVTFAKPALVWRDTAEQPLTAIEFADTVAGQVRSAAFRLRNSGPGGIDLQVLNAVGADAAAFAVSLTSCSVPTAALPANLYEGESCDFVLQFAPTTAGAKAATLQVISTGSLTPALVARGTGIASATATTLQLSTTAVAFDDVVVGSASAPQEVVLMALGSTPLRVTSLDVTGPYAAQSKTCGAPPFLLQPGAECKLAIAFMPTAVGAAAGTLSIAVEGGAPTEVALNANATAEPDVSGGGCTVARGETLADPTLWLLLLGAVVVLVARRRGRWR